MQSRKITAKEMEDGKILLIIPKGEGPNQYNKRKVCDTPKQAQNYLKQYKLKGGINSVPKVPV